MFYRIICAAPLSNKDKKKIQAVETLQKQIGELRATYKKDLASKKDLTKYLCALAIAIMDSIYERVGNEESAEEREHYGVTVFKKKHIKIQNNKITFNYTGKSGVKHKKTLEDKTLAKALKDLLENIEDPEGYVFDCSPGDGEDSVCVRAKDVNEYLKPFKITAKDIRGFHANMLMQKALRERQKSLGKMSDLTNAEKEEKRQEAFLKALEEVSEEVGHESATLRSHYLLPGLESKWVKEDSIETSF